MRGSRRYRLRAFRSAGRAVEASETHPLPLDVSRIARRAFVGEVVMKSEMTTFLRAAQAHSCRFQVGIDMLFEVIRACLEFFGFPSTGPEQLREMAALQY